MKALHLNLLNQTEQRTTSNTAEHVLFVAVGGLLLLASLVWCGFVGIQLYACKAKIDTKRAAIARLDKEAAESLRLKTKLEDLQSEADQYDFYCHARQERGELLKRLAFAIPERISLTTLTIPPPPKPTETRSARSKQLLPQGPTQMVERVELRLTGRATGEEDVFRMMRALEGNSFTGLVSIVKQPAKGERESPRVVSFKQDVQTTGPRGVVFDISYDLTPRGFVK